MNITTICVCCALGLSSGLTHALVVADETNSATNLNDPGGAFPWSNSGYILNGATASATYLGDGWLLTAGHALGIQRDTYLNGILYEADMTLNGGSGYFQLDTDSDPNNGNYADLALYRLTSDPGIASVDLYSGSAGSGTDVVATGRGGTSSGFDTNNTGTPNDDHYNVQRLNSGQEYLRSWGTNMISGAQALSIGGVTADYIWTDLDQPTASDFTPFEFQAHNGDSGGGIYIADGTGEYDLAGIIVHTTGPYFGQLSAEGSRYGDRTLALDLRQFTPQIDAIIGAHETGVGGGKTLPEPNGALLGALGAGLLHLRRRR